MHKLKGLHLHAKMDLSDEGIRADLQKHGVHAESSVSVIAPKEKQKG